MGCSLSEKHQSVGAATGPVISLYSDHSEIQKYIQMPAHNYNVLFGDVFLSLMRWGQGRNR